MTGNVSIRAQNLTKIYHLYTSSLDRLKESLHPFQKKYHHDFCAVNDVSFEVKRGDTVGIIGKNGSGKSTLLKLITGVLTPTAGNVTVNGRISALLELGAGFNPELTGIENIYFNGALMGHSKAKMNVKLDEIISFADIGEFIYQPVKTYSSGMFLRLAFAVNTSVDPEILIVDEALSVGDVLFQQKCIRKMEAFRNRGGTILFVSHDLNAVKVLCNHAYLVDKGSLVGSGTPEEVVNVYNYITAEQSTQIISRENIADHAVEEPFEINSNHKLEHGNLKAEMTKVVMLNKDNIPSGVFQSGESVKIKIHIRGNASINDLVVGILIRDKFGQDIFGTNSHHLKKKCKISKDEKLIYEYNLKMNIGVGDYTLSVALHSGATHLEDNYHWCDAVKAFSVVYSNSFFIGLARLEPELIINGVENL